MGSYRDKRGRVELEAITAVLCEDGQPPDVMRLRDAGRLADEIALGGGNDGEARARLLRAIAQGIGFTVLVVDVDAAGRFRAVIRPNSIYNLAWLQLLDHVSKRPAKLISRPGPIFRTPFCGVCGGVILSTRMAQDKVNKWHAGCKAAGQARARRARQRRQGA